jgi:hypothetical protein
VCRRRPVGGGKIGDRRAAAARQELLRRGRIKTAPAGVSTMTISIEQSAFNLADTGMTRSELSAIARRHRVTVIKMKYGNALEIPVISAGGLPQWSPATHSGAPRQRRAMS